MKEKHQIEKGLDESIRKCLLYFGLFRYPLRPAEIYRFCQYATSKENCFLAVERMAEKGTIRETEGFYSLTGNPLWAEERKAGNERAIQLLKKSKAYVRIIASFPFVEAVAISGSLSKFYASEDADIDHFIITTKNRMWIARSLLHLFKKLTFITGHQHYFCMNYFIDNSAMMLDDRNIYTAIETDTMIPVYNLPLLNEMKDRNSWMEEFLPNSVNAGDNEYVLEMKKPWIKSISEALIKLLFPSHLNKALMNLTNTKWRRKWAKHGYTGEKYDKAFKTTLHISRNHPLDYQDKIIRALEDNTEILQ